MRTGLLWFGWLSLAGSILDGLIAIWLLALAAFAGAELSLSVDAHLRDHLAFLYWIRDVAERLLPDGFVAWIFNLPALVYFPACVVMSVILGGAALSWAARLKTP